MEIVLWKPTLSKAADICEHLAINKKEAKMWIFSVGKENIFCYGSKQDKELLYFHHFKATEKLKDDFSILCNPKELKTLIKTKEKEISLFLDTVNSTLSYEGKHIKYDTFKGQYPIPKLQYKELDDIDAFYDIISRAAKSIGNNTESLIMGGQGLSIKAPIYLKRFIFDYPISRIGLEPSTFKTLATKLVWRKKDDKSIAVAEDNNSLLLKFTASSTNRKESFRQLFVLKNNKSILNEKIELFDTKIVHKLFLSAPNLLEKINAYKAIVKDLYLYDHLNRLIIDPHDIKGRFPNFLDEHINFSPHQLGAEGNRSQDINFSFKDVANKLQLNLDLDDFSENYIQNIEYTGELKRTKISKEGLISFLSGYEGNIEINIEEASMTDGKFYVLTAEAEGIYSSLLAKNEPNFSKVQKMVNEILEQQKQLTYI